MSNIAMLVVGFIATVAMNSPRPAAPPSSQPNWSRTITRNQASLRQPFLVDGIDLAVVRTSYVTQYPDGTAPDTGARIVQVEFWAHNPGKDSVKFFDSFYPYAIVSDGSDTDGEGVNFYPLDAATELGDISLAPNASLHARFLLEIPENATINQLVAYGPVDGAKVTISL